jgi:hypothetical protein
MTVNVYLSFRDSPELGLLAPKTPVSLVPCSETWKYVRSANFDAVWNVWNWEDVAERFEAARRVNVMLSGAGAGVD